MIFYKIGLKTNTDDLVIKELLLLHIRKLYINYYNICNLKKFQEGKNACQNKFRTGISYTSTCWEF